jgi:L-arabinose isomerase
MFTVSLYQMFGTDTLRYRDTAKKVVESLPETLESPVTIDFAKIDFASRSFLQELLYDLDCREVTFENRSEFVERLMEIIQRDAVCVTS